MVRKRAVKRNPHSKLKYVSTGHAIRVGREKYGMRITRESMWRTMNQAPKSWYKRVNRRFKIRDDKILKILARVPKRAVIPHG